jgi:hypothetical protein
MTSPEAHHAYPELAQLAAIRDAGWVFRPFNDEHDDLAGIVGWHGTEDATDVLWIFDRTDCRAARLVLNGPGDLGGIVWDYAGDLASCVGELLSLPHPEERSAPRLVRAAAPVLWTP